MLHTIHNYLNLGMFNPLAASAVFFMKFFLQKCFNPGQNVSLNTFLIHFSYSVFSFSYIYEYFELFGDIFCLWVDLAYAHSATKVQYFLCQKYIQFSVKKQKNRLLNKIDLCAIYLCD
jgi:hypothetical protein